MTETPRRYTAEIEGPFVVFLIGARINRLYKMPKLVGVARAMTAMQKELMAKPELGCLHIENWAGRNTISVQYWRSIELLMAYARDTDAEHLPAWREFNRKVRASGDLGIWHETYEINRHESVYVNMPSFGLAQAGKQIATPDGSTAAQRLIQASS